MLTSSTQNAVKKGCFLLEGKKNKTLHLHHQCPYALSKRPQPFSKIKKLTPFYQPVWNLIYRHAYKSRTPSLLLVPLEGQAIRSSLGQEGRNTQQNLIKQIGFWHEL